MTIRAPRLRSLQSRMIIFFIIIDALLVVVLVIAGIMNSNRLESLYQSRVAEEKAAFEVRLSDKSAMAQAMSADYSVWDDTYSYLLDELPEYPEINISKESLGTFQSDAVWIYKRDLSLATTLCTFENCPSLGEQIPTIAQLLDVNHSIHFFIQADNGILEIFGSTVVPSDDYERAKDHSGYFFIGKLITDESLSALRDTYTVSIKLLGPQEINKYPAKLPAKNGILVFAIEQKDINDKVIGYVYVRYRADSLHELDQLGNRLLWLNNLSFLGVVVATSLAIWIWVIRPVNSISDGLERANTDKFKKLLAKNTEFGRIARLISKFFEQEQLSITEIKNKRELLDKLEAYSTEVEQTNKVMVGRELKMIELKKEIKLLQDQLKDKQ